MKFEKIVTVGVGDSKLAPDYWARVDAICLKRVNLPKDSQESGKEVSDADCLLVGFGVPVTKELIDASPKLKYIGTVGTGYGNVDVAHAASKSISVANVPGYATESVAEFVFAIVLERIRQIERGKAQARQGDYSEAGFSATELKGKVFGVVGLGRIGARVAALARGFGAEAVYWSRNRKQDAEKSGIRYAELGELLRGSDFISIHLGLSRETEGILNAERISMIKPGAVVVNTSPMELVSMQPLAARLKKGDMTFILDHSDEMKPEDVAALASNDSCVVYPPIGYVSREADVARMEIFTSNMERFLEGMPQNVVS